MKSAFLIAAPTSGSGKTTLARGLMALFTQQGLRVQPFKCGPDYIDTKFHEAVCHRPSINLDTFMASEDHIRELFCRYTQGGDEAPEWAREPADIAVVEGMMGLFDVYERDRGSCAEIARVLDLPIVLVVDARSAAYSMAALLQGFTRFRADLRFAGVIFNKVGSPRHAAMLRDVAAEVGIACLGCIPKQTALEQGSRYLGLDFSESLSAGTLVEVLSQSIDTNRLQEICNRSQSPARPVVKASTTGRAGRCDRSSFSAPANMPDTSARRILVARNAESFSFIYQETLDLLHSLGEVEFFDPEGDPPPALPIREGAECNRQDEGLQPAKETTPSFLERSGGGSLLYLPGGYPEKHLDALVRAEGMRRFIREFAEAGGRIIAECGGMMYLCRSIVTDDGEYPMCGVLPYSISSRRADRHLSLGYRRLELEGHELRGHAFHYTQFLPPVPPSYAQVYNAAGEPVPTPILRQGNVLASYTHLAPEGFRLMLDLLFRG